MINRVLWRIYKALHVRLVVRPQVQQQMSVGLDSIANEFDPILNKNQDYTELPHREQVAYLDWLYKVRSIIHERDFKDDR